MNDVRARSMGRSVLIALVLALFLIDAGLVLWRIRHQYYVSVPPLQYAALVWGIITGLVAVLSAVAPAYRIVKAAVTGREIEHRRISVDRAISTAANAIVAPLRNASVAVAVLLVLGGLAATIALYPDAPRSPRTSSGIVVATLGNEKKIYVADPEHGEVLVYTDSDLTSPFTKVPIGSHGNIEGRGRPENMIELKRGKLRLIFVTDTASDKVHVINESSNTVIEPSLVTGKAPRSLAITPDGRKLFVSNEQPIPNGTISVFDVSSDDPKDFRLLSTVTGVNCPEGITLSPGGERLYVATQCGGGKDPVFIIDTAGMEVIGSIPDLAVGTSVSVSPDGDWLYVSRGNQPCSDPETKQRGSPLSVLNLPKREIAKTICLQTSVGQLAVSRGPKGRYLLAANGNHLSIFDRGAFPSSVSVLNDIPLEGGIAGMGIADDNSVYAYLPASKRLFVTSPTGLKTE